MIGEGATGFLESELQQLEDSLLAKIKVFDKLSQIEKIRLAYDLDFFAELERLGLTQIISKLQFEYGSIIKNILATKVEGIATATYEDLQRIMDLDTQSLLRSAQSYASQFQSSLIKGFISGETTGTIISRLGEIGLKTNQLIAAVTTARDEFQAVSMAKLFEDDETQRFILAGPLDNRTRCSCKAVLLNQPKSGWTKKEIDEGAATKIALANCPKFEGQYSFVFRGKFNCRHHWQIAD